jgi:peptidoglycan/xylan/chitin deacetylase (PgdA/CDA1 family)
MKESARLARLTVLGFHSISDLTGTKIARYGIPKFEFEAAIDTLSDAGFDFIEPADLFSSYRLAGRRALLITFDDCYEDVMDAFEVLNHRSIRALIFPVSSMIGKSNEWDLLLGAPKLPLLGLNKLRSLVASGWIVGSHTHTHSDLTSLDDASVIREIWESIAFLDGRGLNCARVLAYPYGKHNQRITTLAKESGLTLAFTTEAGVIAEDTDPLAIPRVEVYRGDCADRLLRKIREGINE